MCVLCVCACVRMCVRACAHARACVCVCVCVYVPARVYIYVCVCVCLCVVCVCTHLCVRVCVHAHMSVRVYAGMLSSLHRCGHPVVDDSKRHLCLQYLHHFQIRVQFYTQRETVAYRCIRHGERQRESNNINNRKKSNRIQRRKSRFLLTFSSLRREPSPTHIYRLVGLMVKASASRAEGPGFESH